MNSIEGANRIQSLNTLVNNIQTNININNHIDNNKTDKALSSASNTNNVVTNEMLDKAIEDVNKHVGLTNRKFEYAIHEGTNKVVIRVFNSDTGEVIREVPPESRLDAISKMWEMSGIIVDSVV